MNINEFPQQVNQVISIAEPYYKVKYWGYIYMVQQQ